MQYNSYSWPEGLRRGRFGRLALEQLAVARPWDFDGMVLAGTSFRAAAIIVAVSFVYLLCPIQARAAEPAADSSFLSRITVDVPVYSRHEPHSERFNNHNWGAFVEIAINEHWSLATGDFINSYKRATIFAGAAWMPVDFSFYSVRVRVGGMLGLDVNGGYRRYNEVNPLLGAASLRITGSGFENDFFNRLGIAVKVIPPAPKNGSTAINFALSYRLG